MGGIIDRVVEKTEAGRVPSFTHFRVEVNRAVEVGVDPLEDSCVDLVIVVLQSVVEDHLEVGVVTEVLIEVFGRGSTVQADVGKSKGSRLVGLGSGEVHGNG